VEVLLDAEDLPGYQVPPPALDVTDAGRTQRKAKL
jgi:hypothetical protein